MMEWHNDRGARYGVDIKGTTRHEEADHLVHIGPLLVGHSGRAFVFDRASHSLLLEGSVDEVRDALGTLTASCKSNTPAPLERDD